MFKVIGDLFLFVIKAMIAGTVGASAFILAYRVVLESTLEKMKEWTVDYINALYAREDE